jgi:hypothetical protein
VPRVQRDRSLRPYPRISRPLVNISRKYNCNNQVAEDEMGGPCSTNGGEEERV